MDDYAGYYASTGYDADGSGNVSDDADGFDADLVAHVQLYGDGTYEMLYFAALVNGEWEVATTEKGSEYVALLMGRTVDKDLEKLYGEGELAFMLVRNPNEVNSLWLMQMNSKEEVIMEKQKGDMDFDAVAYRIEMLLTGGAGIDM